MILEMLTGAAIALIGVILGASIRSMDDEDDV